MTVALTRRAAPRRNPVPATVKLNRTAHYVVATIIAILFLFPVVWTILRSVQTISAAAAGSVASSRNPPFVSRKRRYSDR